MTEKRVKEAVKAHLKSIGAYYFMPVQMGMGASSIDFLICYKGRFYGVETKRPEVGEPTGRQVIVMKAIVDAGGVVCLENSVGLESVKLMLERELRVL